MEVAVDAGKLVVSVMMDDPVVMDGIAEDGKPL